MQLTTTSSLGVLTLLGALVHAGGAVEAQKLEAHGLSPQYEYDVVELPDLGGPYHDVHVYDLNDSGVAVGYVLDAQLRWRAVRWDRDGNVTDLGGGSATWSIARGISAGGIVSGFHGATLQTARPALWIDGAIVPLDDPPEGGGVEAYDVNDSLQAVGRGHTGFDSFAAMWDVSGASSIAAPLSYAFAINERGTAAGFVTVGGFPAAARWDDGQLTVLPGLGVANAKAIGVDDGGTIVGHAASATDQLMHAVMWRAGSLVDLGAYQDAYITGATGVNEHGVVVGFFYLDPLAEITRALVWRPGGEARNLNDLDAPDSGWILDDATAVNAAGWIVGRGSHASLAGKRAYVAKPR